MTFALCDGLGGYKGGHKEPASALRQEGTEEACSVNKRFSSFLFRDHSLIKHRSGLEKNEL